MPMLDGWIAVNGALRRGRLRYGATIEALDLEDRAPRAWPDDDAPRVLPGFIDTHVHGGGGGDTMDGEEGVRTLARHHLRHGTTTLLPTTITQRWPRVRAALDAVRAVRDARDPALPDIPGAHLEGPFLSPDRLGAQPPFAIEPKPRRVAEVLTGGVVRVVTLAPELDGAVEAARRFAAAGVRVSVGHTRADSEQVAAVAEAVHEAGGVLGFTHLFNAMGGMAGRQPGALGYALAEPTAWAELILDGHHVHATSFRAALAAKPERLHLVTDAIRACGLPEGESELGGQTVVVEEGAVRLPNGALAGSVLTLDRALRNAVAAGLTLGAASRLLSDIPSRYLDLDDRGRIEPGRRADLVALDAGLNVQRVFVAGREVAGAAPRPHPEDPPDGGGAA